MAPLPRVAVLLLVCLACGPGEDVPPSDGGVRADGGLTPTDAGSDAGADAGTDTDAGVDPQPDGGAEQPPQALRHFGASVLGPDSIALSWESGEAEPTPVELERAPAESGPFAPLTEISAAASSHVDSGLTPGATYAYRARARSGAGVSPWSSVVTVTLNQTATTAPDAPQSLQVTPVSAQSLRVTWTLASEELRVELDRATTSTGPWVRVHISAAGALSFDDAGLTPATTYWYRARALRSGLSSADAGPVSAATPQVPPPPAPSGLAGVQEVANSQGTVRLTWSDVATETHYEVQRSSNDVDWGPLVSVPANATSWIDLAPTFGSNYYRLRAVNAGGTSNWATAGVYAGPVAIGYLCPTPTDSSVAVLSETAARVTWALFNNGYCSMAAIERADTEGGPFVELARVYLPSFWPPPPTTSYDDTTVTPGRIYFYRVRHLATSSGWMHSPYTAPVSVQTPSSLAPPDDVTPQVVSSSTVEFSWSDPATDETGFSVEFTTAAGGPFSEAFRVPANTTLSHAQGFTPATQYWVRVRTVRGDQLSAPSTPVSFTTASVLVLRATADTTVFESSALLEARNDRSTTGPNEVGCFFNWSNDLNGVIYLYHHCPGSALRFETQPLSGRTVLSATLRLTPGGLAPHLSDEARYAAFALTAAWNPATVTFNTLPARDSAGWAVVPPTSGAASLFNVTSIAQRWASGALGHHGLYVQHFPIQDRLPPNGADFQDQTTLYCSLEQQCGSLEFVPTLIVEYL